MTDNPTAAELRAELEHLVLTDLQPALAGSSTIAEVLMASNDRLT